MAIHEGHMSNRVEVEAWLAAIFERNISQLDLPVLERLYQAYEESDLEQAKYWNQFVLASRETFELTKEERDIGSALGRLLRDLGHPNPIADCRPGYVSQFAWAGMHWGISATDLKSGFAFAWFENQLAAATKLVPLGQTDAQRALSALCTLIPDAVARTFDDEDIGQSLPGFAAMSSWHEDQAARLFRS